LNIFRTPFFLPWVYPQLTWRIPTSEKLIYLTFDDGPVPGPTELVLDTLNRFNVKGTFFCIGDNIRKHSLVFNRILNEGHEVANHTYHHINGWRSKADKYVENINLCQAEILKYQSKPNSLFRPPYGRISKGQISQLKDYRIVMWDVLTHDYNRNIHAEVCLSQSIKATRPGSIIVFHDSHKAEKNMSYVLPRYVAHFINQGFTFTLLSDALRHAR
jgi:peptidoglycan/xylan/chitin deacetylase (PgdA/CDA1 family)